MRRRVQIARNRTHRRGSIAALSAVFLVVVLAVLAFSIDLGYIVATKSELQNAADAGAMSGARALQDGHEAAVEAAKTWVAKNTAAGEVVVITDEDVEIGRWDSDLATFTVVAANSNQPANSVRVTCRRTAAEGNPLHLFFAPVFGTNDVNLTASATACVKPNTCGVIVGVESVEFTGGSSSDSYNSEHGPYSSSQAPTMATSAAMVQSRWEVAVSLAATHCQARALR